MTPDPATEYAIEMLASHHERSRFRCGADALDRYLQQQAGQDARRRVASPYVLVQAKDRVITGFYTLANAGLNLTDLPPELAKKLPRYPQLPATLLGRLAVDLEHRGRGLGEFLLLDALRRSLHSSETTAAYAVVVDAKDDSAAKFYRTFGFLPLVGHRHRWFLPMQTISQLAG